MCARVQFATRICRVTGSSCGTGTIAIQVALKRRLNFRNLKIDASASSAWKASSANINAKTKIPGPYEVVVAGGGAAGLTAAFFAAQNGARVLVIERTREAGRKVLMSGGTRCNVLPVEVDLQRDYFTSSSRSAFQAVMSSWSIDECRYWLESAIPSGCGLDLVEESATNKYFPASNSARQVRDNLLTACIRHGAEVRYNSSLEGLEQMEDNTWVCKLQDGSAVESKRVVMATGGSSFPLVGTDGTGYKLLAGLGHKVIPTYAALTPLTGTHPAKQQLAGLSMYDVILECQTGPKLKSRQVASRTGFLFTHKGYSGPAVLDLSHHAVQSLDKNGALPEIRANWTGASAEEWESWLQRGGPMQVATLLQRHGVRERLADALCEELGLTGRTLAQLKKVERKALITALTAFPLPYSGHEGYRKAEVTGGGVALSNIDCSTMESRVSPGLHLCGEVLDVFGRIGGFNFYWAWVTGRAAGMGAARGLGAAQTIADKAANK